jgi:cobalt/nickel transport protein
MRRTAALAVLAILAAGGRSAAHFPMLLPSPPSAKKGEGVTLLYQWGHPFEHQLFDAPDPLSLTVRAPDGKQTDLTASLRKVAVAAGEGKAAAFRFEYTPEVRGDHVFVLEAPPLWMEVDREFLRDTAQAVLHVQAQKGWEGPPDLKEGWRPLTRPYGLQPGMVFQAQALLGGRPLAGALVEVEHFNPEPPRELPPDEQITRTVRTDPNGVATATLTEPGWWALTASTPGETKERDGKAYPVRRRLTLWVHVDEAPRGR